MIIYKVLSMCNLMVTLSNYCKWLDCQVHTFDGWLFVVASGFLLVNEAANGRSMTVFLVFGGS